MQRQEAKRWQERERIFGDLIDEMHQRHPEDKGVLYDYKRMYERA